MLKTKINTKKKCEHCKKPFKQFNSFHVYCKPDCLFADMERKKREDYMSAIQGEGPTKKADSVSRQHSLTQPVFNEWARVVKEQDATCCISCQRPRGAWQEHCGHFKSVGASGILRYEPDNAHIQCPVCNTHKSGNIVEYRKHLVIKIGLDRVEWLEAEAGKTRKYQKSELQDLRSKLNEEIRLVKKAG